MLATLLKVYKYFESKILKNVIYMFTECIDCLYLNSLKQKRKRKIMYREACQLVK